MQFHNIEYFFLIRQWQWDSKRVFLFFNNQYRMKISNFSIGLGFLALLCLFGYTDCQCCLKTVPNSKKCAECPKGTHLFKGNCLLDIDKCLKYNNGFECSECEQGYFPSSDSCSKDQPKDYEDKYVQLEENDNALILADYTRSVHQEVATANVLEAIIRKHTNGTEQTIIHYETTDKKYFQSVGLFSLESAFIFELKDFKQLNEKPVKPTPPKDTGNGTTDPPKTDPPTNTGNGPQQNPFGISKINYKYLNFSERSSDEGFVECDKLIKDLNKNALGANPIVLAAYAQLQGLNIEFFAYYESTDKKSIYESRTVYQIYRKKVFILSFNKTYLK